MAGDFSRNSVNPVKHYSGVLMQQGRVQVDADWNEQLALQHHRTHTETSDVIGNCGTPKNGGGFRISVTSDSGDLLIAPGRYYVHGLLCELDPEKILVSFPAAIATAAPSPKFKSAGLKAKPGLKQLLTTHGASLHQAKWTDPQGQVNVPSLWFDDRPLTIGDWVELSATGVKSVQARITQISDNTPDADPDAITPNYYTLTLDRSVSEFQLATEAWLNRVITFTTQPFLHSPLDASFETSPPSPPGQAILHLLDGSYLVAIEAWQREVDALEDPHIREVALGGPDTAERLQTVWQVHVVPYSASSPLTSPPSSPPLDCCSDFPGWDQYKATLVTTGLMNAQAPPPGNNVSLCQLPPSAGFLGLTNQLYRVEIFQSGDYNGGATLVWSRDNAMVETDIICIDSTGIVYVSSIGKDDLHSFSENDWVEIYDVDDELLGKPRFLAQITAPTGTSSAPPCAPGVGQAFTLTLTPTPTAFAGRSNLSLRRWDMPASATMALDENGNPVGIPITSGWIQLENNIQVNFTPGFYATRSYWQIPARTATGDIEWPPFEVPNTNPIPQPPLGVPHYFCRLALLTVTYGKWHLVDCRCKFPSLTDICADDICFHSTRCELQNVKTVEEALNELDARIRFHNKMLHGWGVVCGLKVACPGANATPTSVRVSAGYAIDCEGDDLKVDKETIVDFSDLLRLSPHEHQIHDGDYELLLERKSPRERLELVVTSGDDEACCDKSPIPGLPETCFSFRAIECRQKNFWSEVLEGTLWQDFHDKCLQPLINEFTNDYSDKFVSPLSPPAPNDQRVSKAQALLSSLTSLFAQVLQPNRTSDVWVSPQEDSLLREFYFWLWNQLSDKTFCSLTDSPPSYPLYPFPDQATLNPVSTIFGMGFKTRMRVGPEGKRAYTVGVDNNIHVYDLVSGQLASMVQLPTPANSTGWVVQDVAFSFDGSQIYAIATGTNPNTNAFDSLFAVGTVNNDFTVTWQQNFSAGALSFLTLATAAVSPNFVYAVAQGQGLYSIDLTKKAVNQASPFNAIGHLTTLPEDLFATANSGQAAGGNFDQVLRFPVGTGGVGRSTTFALTGFSGDASDDLLTVNSPFAGNFEGFLLFVTATAAGSSNTNKQLLIYQALTTSTSASPQTVDLGEKATVRLAANQVANSLMVTFEESCRIKSVTNVGQTITVSSYWPTEVNPTAIALPGVEALRSLGAAAAVYVLNSTSSTISPIPVLTPAFNDFTALENYRTNAISAFTQLLAALLQQLKDCFCDLLLVKCPTCNNEEGTGIGVPLACVTFKEGKVHQICNLEKRKYVHTFPSVEYWLSVVPVIPLVRTALERLCCADLPSLFQKFTPPTPKNQPGFTSFTGTITPEGARSTITKLQGFSVNDFFTSASKSFMPARTLTLDALFRPLQATPAVFAVNRDQVIGQPVQQAAQTLVNAKINVAAVAAYDPADFVSNISAYTSAPNTLPAGSSVTLVTDSQGVVKYYVPGSAEVTQLRDTVQANQNQVQTQFTALQQAQKPALDQVTLLQTQVTSLQSQIANMQTLHAQELATRDQQIATLNSTTQQMQTQLKTVDDLAAQVKQLAGQIPPKTPKTKG